VSSPAAPRLNAVLDAPFAAWLEVAAFEASWVPEAEEAAEVPAAAAAAPEATVEDAAPLDAASPEPLAVEFPDASAGALAVELPDASAGALAVELPDASAGAGVVVLGDALAAAWNASKVFWGVALMLKTMPIWQWETGTFWAQ